MGARSRILGQLSLAHKSGRVDDAWARIRTWEPLREGILSPSPLTGLGYPRAAAQRPRSVKPFASRSLGGRTIRAFFMWADFRAARAVSNCAILHQGILRRNRGSPQHGSRVGEESRDDHRENRSHMHRSQRVVSRRHPGREGGRPRGRARRPRRLQVRRRLRCVDETRERRGGFPRARVGWEDPVPGFNAEGHGPDGPAGPHYPARAAGSEGVLATAQNAMTATRRQLTSRTPSRKAVPTKRTVQVWDPTNATLSGPATRKWLTSP